MSTNRTSPFLPLSSQETVQDQHLGLAQVLMKLLSPLVPGACKTLCAPSKRSSASSPVPLCSSPTGLQSQMFLGFFSQCPGPRLGNWCMAQNSTPIGELLQYNCSLDFESPTGGPWDIVTLLVYPFLQSPCVFFLSLNVEYLFGSFQSFLLMVVR